MSPRAWRHATNAALIVVWTAALASNCGCATSYDRARARATDQTSVGMAVVDEDRVLPPGLAEAAVTDVLSWWQARYPHQTGQLRSYFARGGIVVSAGEGPLPPTLEQAGNGEIARDNWVQVRWERRTGGDRFDSWLRHGLGHVAISALRWGGERMLPDDHDQMKLVDYPWE